ncbi:MAG TPA: hypothetical protein VGS79_21805 [Puia sp.]|nr:hypothetical protein [Puia sp.]
MTRTLFLALTFLATASAFAQTPAKPRPSYSADSFLLRSNGPRIFLYSFCPAYGEPGRAVYFRKDQDSVYHRVSIRNLRVAVADNPASLQELRIAGTNIGVGIGLLAGGVALSTIGILTTVHHNNEINNAYNQATAQWYAQAQAHPFANNPAPALPHSAGLSPLFYLGTAMTLSAIIPLANVGKHAQRAINIYNQ